MSSGGGKKNNEKKRFKNAQKFTRCYNLLCDIRLTSSNNNLFTHTHRLQPRRVTPRGAQLIFISPVQLYSIRQINPVSSWQSSVHTQMVLFSSVAALRVVR